MFSTYASFVSVEVARCRWRNMITTDRVNQSCTSLMTVMMVTPTAGQRTSFNTISACHKVTTHQCVPSRAGNGAVSACLASIVLVQGITARLCRFNLVIPPQAVFFFCQSVKAGKSPLLFMHWAEHGKNKQLASKHRWAALYVSQALVEINPEIKAEWNFQVERSEPSKTAVWFGFMFAGWEDECQSYQSCLSRV